MENEYTRQGQLKPLDKRELKQFMDSTFLAGYFSSNERYEEISYMLSKAICECFGQTPAKSVPSSLKDLLYWLEHQKQDGAMKIWVNDLRDLLSKDQRP